MSLTEIQKSLEDAQWEAEYGEERARLLAEELESAKADGGERDHDACFPKSEVWTVWIHRIIGDGLLVRFTNSNDAQAYGATFLSKHCKEYYLNAAISQMDIKSIGQSSELQLFMFAGLSHNVTKICETLYIVSEQKGLELGLIGIPTKFKKTDESTVFKVIS